MNIGASLVNARQQAGLTVAQVSQRTRIRETIIRAMESDEFLACGGDIYARGHIRSVSQVVGADSESLVAQYDSMRWAQQSTTPAGTTPAVSWAADSWAGESPAEITQPLRHVRPVPPSRGTPAAAGGAAVPSARPAVPAAPAPFWPFAPVQPVMAARPAASSQPDEFRRVNRPAPLGLKLAFVVVLVAAVAVAAVQLVSGVRRSAASAPGAPRHHLATHRPGAPGQLSQGQKAVPAVHTPVAGSARKNGASALPRRLRQLVPVSAAAFGVSGPGDNPRLAGLAIDGNPATAWRTDWYTTALFGNLYPGTGLLLDMGHAVTVSHVQVTLGNAAGASLQLRVGGAAALPALTPVASASGANGANGVLHLEPGGRAVRVRYVLVWLTSLPPDPNGTFLASVYDIRLEGRA